MTTFFSSVQQITTILSVCRLPHFYICADEYTFIFVHMTAHYMYADDHTLCVQQVIGTKWEFQIRMIFKPVTWLPYFIPQSGMGNIFVVYVWCFQYLSEFMPTAQNNLMNRQIWR